MDPKSVPTELALYPTMPVLLVTLEASDAGYQIVEARTIPGAINRVPFGSHDVLVSAEDGSGVSVASTSFVNPRAAHTTGAKSPQEAVLPAARITILLPAPDRIRVLSIKVVSGPNAGLETRLPLPSSPGD
ncbi:MAG: hypothetical protein ABI895_09415 [Deltaproteobacteria bacterium]